MTDFFLDALRSNPELAVFLAVALGVLIGRIRLGSFHLGSVAGALLMGLVIGQVGLEVPHELKSVFFVLFIYAVGFKSGPEFFGSLNRGHVKAGAALRAARGARNHSRPRRSRKPRCRASPITTIRC